MRIQRGIAAIGLAVLLLAGACASNDPDDEASTTTSGDTTESTAEETTEASAPESSEEPTEASSTTEAPEDPFADLEGPAPGVTADSVKIGVTYVDAESLRTSGLELDLGDYEGAFNAVVDDINANGGIHGRMIELVFAPIAPSDPAATEAQCTKLTEDDDVFLVAGFFLGDAHMCPLELHDTAVVGAAGMPADEVARTNAPWITPLVDLELINTSVETFAEEGLLDGTLGVFGHERDQADLDSVLATLEALGVEAAEVGIADAPSGDIAATTSDVQVLEEVFKSAGIDTVLLVGASAQNWPKFKTDPDYNPQIVSASLTALQAFVEDESVTDTSPIEGALAGGIYGPNQAIYEAMEECAGVVEAAGVEFPTPEEAEADDSQAFQNVFLACPYMALTQTWLEAAGPNLNYATLEAALEQGFELTLPGEVEPRAYGPAPAADGDPAAYIYEWDEAGQEFIRQG